jgi:hypothetical protein
VALAPAGLAFRHPTRALSSRRKEASAPPPRPQASTRRGLGHPSSRRPRPPETGLYPGRNAANCGFQQAHPQRLDTTAPRPVPTWRSLGKRRRSLLVAVGKASNRPAALAASITGKMAGGASPQQRTMGRALKKNESTVVVEEIGQASSNAPSVPPKGPNFSRRFAVIRPLKSG